MSTQKAKICLVTLLVLSLAIVSCIGEEAKKEQKKKKSVVDMTDHEIEKIYEEWEAAEEEQIPDDELPPYLRKNQPSIDMSSVMGKGAEGIKAMGKKGKSLMMFVTVSGDPTESESAEITGLWQSSLFNANLQCTRYMMESNKAIFMVDDGSKAYEMKDFLVRQDRCLEVTIDQEIFPGLVAKSEHKKEDKKKEL